MFLGIIDEVNASLRNDDFATTEETHQVKRHPGQARQARRTSQQIEAI
jgi:hypothetical protein